MKLVAVIFDLDGTIIDSREAWGRAFSVVLKSLGVEIKEKYPDEPGIAVRENWRRFIVKFNIKTDKTLDELRSLTYHEYMKLIPEISLNDGVVEFIENLKDSGTEIALATSTSWEAMDKILNSLKIQELFDYITTSEEVTSQKPQPDIFIRAMEKMNLDPSECLVIEDSPSGVTAAKEAGIKVIALDPEEKNGEVLSKADLIVGGFSEISPKIIGEL
jgi:HAD superfamily hydrolase (TIGR01509 family)